MTTHYIDITLLPDPEFADAHLLGALVAKLHRALVQLRSDGIGVSFPGYSLCPRSPGRVLRLHGAQSALRELLALTWLQGMRDHVELTDVLTAPANATRCVVRRRQFKTNVERLRRRRMRRKGETVAQAAAAIPESVERKPDLPYVHVRSASTGQPFCLFIEQVIEGEVEGKGGFNSYGLSAGGAVPWF
ncbi:type I-F CRISPR-associated endoribonuclease Cas6/Csy4 [Paraburkholderia sp. Ac-20340]|uniref:type I-F CRISPR-associated endoribonuclease Cas6/Csy4 n=1 Tax=Paraburkholderia sp. Ac-20340 TaxID=2703888 RepID=UPI001982186D|nr:type I-F CRISPR-associated endoribonuclease Cas6/Csy4 [Paraburkholderia sp. Ac-20340]MBN3857918.1 type I-F CRISPR-associated endoribonuclease Cas6/Csy4 [Paraburkholderia sp. Ac-20340]